MYRVRTVGRNANKATLVQTLRLSCRRDRKVNASRGDVLSCATVEREAKEEEAAGEKRRNKMKNFGGIRGSSSGRKKESR